jgi:MFS transporter, ACS family, glucarate transporter
MMSTYSTRTSVRRRMLILLWGFAFFSYLLRMNISIAQQYMRPELGLSDIQIGYVFSAFMFGYAIFQVPAGVLGDRFGPRLILTAAALSWAFATLLTGLVPGILVKGASAALASLLVLRFILGIGESATYPVGTRAVANWFPVSEHASANALIFTGSTLGAAFTPPLIANLMKVLGWRSTFYISAVFPFLLALLWWWKFRDRPDQHRSVSQAELALITGDEPQSGITTNAKESWTLLRNRNIVILSLSYFLESYVVSIFVFWFFRYLLDVRKFSIVGSGWASSLPWIVASLAVPPFGYLSDRLSMRYGTLQGRRVVAIGCLAASAMLLLAGASVPEALIAITAISFSVGFVFSTETAYWSTAIELAGSNAGAASGFMNLAGNLGGVVSTSMVPLLVHSLGWFSALLSGSLFALLAAAFWLMLRPPPGTVAHPTAAL